MVVVNKPIETVVEFSKGEQYPNILRFRMDIDGNLKVIQVTSVTGKSIEKINNTKCVRYLCTGEC